MLDRLLHTNIALEKHLKAILVGGAKCEDSLLEQAKLRGYPIHLTYGMTETSSQITCGRFHVGHPLKYRHLQIADDGEILIKGPMLFSGYRREDGSLSLPVNEKGFFHTKDIGTYSKDEGLVIKGRKDRMFITCGENIHPEEIERTIERILGIGSCLIQAQQDPEKGQVPVAYIDAAFNEKELKEQIREILPSIKQPVAYFQQKLQQNFKKSGEIT